MPEKMLWVGIPLLALTLAGGVYVANANRAGDVKASAGNTQLTADVMDTAKSCCASQEASTESTPASASTVSIGLTSQPVAGQANVECDPAKKASSDLKESGTNADCPVEKSQATRAMLAKQESVGDMGVCPVTGAKVAKTDAVKPATTMEWAGTKTATVAERKVASAAK